MVDNAYDKFVNLYGIMSSEVASKARGAKKEYGENMRDYVFDKDEFFATQYAL